ncbi:DUF3054 domain-containing protein [Myceligenerans pegani]|uniref:DUF3054 domain-containing protein n=1 Tax=Myceligenerans pegani TaxID=2776917 RepID=A0ABR9N0L3_9MICO|nr:DUF3054 domain-containing protein [Myceligenerans sp. TRM 65318]MBE1877197.1 DUF3054 domain-containing protein [Myceligenerans sp. TRM 65318]MBE3019468.1 DUF3054 domain-containing protein [Myceligenerans sp. TRM 65318]
MTTADDAGRPGAGRIPVAPGIVADAVAVLVFAIAGMRAHDTLVLELGRVVWPFAVGAAVGWAWTRAWHDPARIWPVGVGVWFTTVVGGMILRVATGGSSEISFLLVTAAFLGVTMLGWRGMVTVLRRGARKQEAK